MGKCLSWVLTLNPTLVHHGHRPRHRQPDNVIPSIAMNWSISLTLSNHPSITKLQLTELSTNLTCSSNSAKHVFRRSHSIIALFLLSQSTYSAGFVHSWSWGRACRCPILTTRLLRNQLQVKANYSCFIPEISPDVVTAVRASSFGIALDLSMLFILLVSTQRPEFMNAS